ncbi:MAG: biopolymer transporter ExbB [Lentisphaerae bacterium]|nr:biopolymer transporter ExbB [Lentisphaerota bacterium]
MFFGGLPALPFASVLYAFRVSNFAGKAIVELLFLGSILAWSLMLTKWRELSAARRASERFVAAYRKESHPASLFLKRQRFAGSPLYAIYEKTCAEVGATLEVRGSTPEDLFMGGVGASAQKLSPMEVSAIRNVAESTLADTALMLENRMGLLATAVSSAPFLGLLGTVWGVMDAFAGMAAFGSAMLSAVAPGIAGALLTTVVGLLVALPSAIGYNLLTDRIRGLTVAMNNFCQELMSDVERNYLRD